MANRILIADDNEALVQSLSLLFEMNGYVVSASMSVDGAVSLLKEKSFDCLLFNLKIGHASGEEILWHLGVDAIESPPRVIIAMSGGTPEQELQRFRDMVTTVLVRPFSFEDLLSEIKWQLGRAPR